MTNLDDFREHDPERSLLEVHLPEVYKAVEMIARLYVSDSLRYPDQAEYWLNYAHELAAKMLMDCKEEGEGHQTRRLLTNVKRCQALRCAFLMD